MKKAQTMYMIIPNDIHFGVFESQMLGLAKYYTKYYEVSMIVPYSIDLCRIDTEIDLITYSNNNDLKRIIKKSDIVYLRSVVNFIELFISCRVNKLKILYDFRGFVSFETFYKKRNHIKFIILFLSEFLAYMFSNKIQCVSRKMKSELHNKFIKRKSVDVVPCLTQKSYRRIDGCPREIRFVFVGGISKWQMLDLILEVSLKIQNEMSCKFTFITNKPLALEELIKSSGLLNYSILSGDNNFVQSVLKEQDFGFLLRENRLFNRVASPIKFLEYMSNGVIPIITPHVGDYSRDLLNDNLGIVYDNDIQKLINDIKIVSHDISEYRERGYNYSSEHTWDNYQVS